MGASAELPRYLLISEDDGGRYGPIESVALARHMIPSCVPAGGEWSIWGLGAGTGATVVARGRRRDRRQ